MKTFTLLLSLLFLVSCTEHKNTIIDYPSATHKNLAENKKLWKNKNIQNYSFVVRKSCYCPHEENRQITVQNDTISEVKFIPSNTTLARVTKVKKVDDYFNIIQEALDKNAYKLTVNYDKTYGFPTQISIDYNEQMVDEEISYTLTHFQKDKDNIACPEIYMPVCGKINIQCATTPCETIKKTFTSQCFLNANPNATYLKDGEC